jgi:hypothetical protein
MTDDLTLDDVKRAAERAGWSLSEEDLSKLLKGGLRGRRMAALARKYATQDTEPAGVFSARRSDDQP